MENIVVNFHQLRRLRCDVTGQTADRGVVINNLL
jgi:hypothetical protein